MSKASELMLNPPSMQFYPLQENHIPMMILKYEFMQSQQKKRKMINTRKILAF